MVSFVIYTLQSRQPYRILLILLRHNCSLLRNYQGLKSMRRGIAAAANADRMINSLTEDSNFSDLRKLLLLEIDRKNDNKIHKTVFDRIDTVKIELKH
jgi:hypothetical protein